VLRVRSYLTRQAIVAADRAFPAAALSSGRYHTMKYNITLLMLAVIFLAGCSTTYVSPKAWDAAREGMTRQQIASSLGRPAFESPSHEVWRDGHWELEVAYDENGRATNVVRSAVLK